MEQLGPGRVGSFIVDFLARPAADDQPGGLQLPQVVGDGGAAHLHQGGQVEHALFTVAQQPEDADAAAVPQLLEDVGHGLEVVGAGHVLQLLLNELPVVMGQENVGHGAPSFLFVIIT